MYGKMFSASDENGPPGQSSEEDEAQKETRKLLTERLRYVGYCMHVGHRYGILKARFVHATF